MCCGNDLHALHCSWFGILKWYFPSENFWIDLAHVVRPDMRYCSRSRCFHPDPGTKHISVPPRHMTKPYAPDFQHDITTLQIQGYNISYSRHTTASNRIQQRKIHVWVQSTIKCLLAKRKSSIPITTRVQALRRVPPN